MNGLKDEEDAPPAVIDGELRVELFKIEENTGTEEARFNAIMERFIEAGLRREGRIP